MRTKNLSFPWLQWQVQELTVHCIALSRTNVSIPGHHTYIPPYIHTFKQEDSLGCPLCSSACRKVRTVTVLLFLKSMV